MLILWRNLIWLLSSLVCNQNRGENRVREPRYYCTMEAPKKQAGKQQWRKYQTELLCGATVALLGVYPRQVKSGCHRDVCTLVLIVALFLTDDPGIKATRGWVLTEYHLTTKKRKVSFMAMWLNLEDLTLSEITQIPREKSLFNDKIVKSLRFSQTYYPWHWLVLSFQNFLPRTLTIPLFH